MDIIEQLGKIDIYLLDQVLRGNVRADATILDAGCGGGRNLHYFFKRGHSVAAVDSSPVAIEQTSRLAIELGHSPVPGQFRVEAVEDMSFDDRAFDLVICNAVLHFARDFGHFEAMVEALSRVVRSGGIVFCRLASTIGLESFLDDAAETPGWHRLPDGSDRFLVDLDTLISITERLGVELVDPIKTVNVQNLRCMTNWVWRR